MNTRDDGFAPGNEVAVKHGAYSERAIAEKAATIRDALYETASWLDPDRDGLAVARFLRVEARCLLLQAAIEKQSAERGGPDKVSMRLYEQATSSDRLAGQLGSVLGLDPLGRARLQAQANSAEITTRSLADLAEEGRAIRVRAEQRIAAAEGDVLDGDGPVAA